MAQRISHREYRVRRIVAFTGAAGLGAVGTVALYTVTGAVGFKLTAICTENLVSAGGGTISVDTAGAVAGVIAVTTATDIDVGDIWFAAAPATVLDTVANAELEFVIDDGADLQANVLVGDITDGTIEFNIIWWPLTTNGRVE